MTAYELIRTLRIVARNCAPSLHKLLDDAADMIEKLDERVSIMSEHSEQQND